MNIEIFRAENSDVDKILKIEESLESKILSNASIITDLKNKNCYYFIAKYNNEFIGYVAASFLVDHLDIISVAVIENYRKNGVATRLLEKMFETAKILNIQNIFLEVRCSNISAISFYEKLGFKKISTRKHYYINPTEDALIYVKELVK